MVEKFSLHFLTPVLIFRVCVVLYLVLYVWLRHMWYYTVTVILHSSLTPETMETKLKGTSGDYLFQTPIQSRVNFKVRSGCLWLCLFKFWNSLRREMHIIWYYGLSSYFCKDRQSRHRLISAKCTARFANSCIHPQKGMETSSIHETKIIILLLQILFFNKWKLCLIPST